MRSKELIKKVKNEIKQTKDKALRQALTERKAKGETTEKLTKLLGSLVDDSSHNKMASHLRLKAFAMSDSSFVGYSKGKLCFLFLVYDLRFMKSKSKKFLSKRLVDKIASTEMIPRHDIATRQVMEKALTLYEEGKKVDSTSLGLNEAPINRPTEVRPNDVLANMNTVSDGTHGVGQPQARPRLQRFKPSEEQEQILRRDSERYEGKVPKRVRTDRANEFGVQESQIQRWLTSYKKQTNQNTQATNIDSV